MTRSVQSLDQGEWLRPHETETRRVYSATSSSIARPVFAHYGLALILSGVEVGHIDVEVGHIDALGVPSADVIRRAPNPNDFWRTVLADQERPPFGYPQRLGQGHLE